MKPLLALLAVGGLLIGFQHPTQAQVGFGIPLPFPFAFYNFNQGYQQPYYAQRAYYSQGDYCRPGSCTPARHVYFQRRYYRPRYQYYYRPRPQYYQQGYYQPEYYQQGGYYGPGWGGYGGW